MKILLAFWCLAACAVCACAVDDLGGARAALDVDSDYDGILDDVDNCPAFWNVDQADGDVDGAGDACDVDSDIDGDGFFDYEDRCPTEPTLQWPVSICGCDPAAARDDDGDGVRNCHDRCDVDADGDGTYDCYDGCNYDPDKISPGVCGCDVPETC